MLRPSPAGECCRCLNDRLARASQPWFCAVVRTAHVPDLDPHTKELWLKIDRASARDCQKYNLHLLHCNCLIPGSGISFPRKRNEFLLIARAVDFAKRR